MFRSNQKYTDLFTATNGEALRLEQVDQIVRKCNHLHDETIGLTITRLFKKLATRSQQAHGHGKPTPAH